MVKIIEMLIPKSNKRTRPGTKRTPRSITIHETANLNVRANALAHAKLQFLGNPRQASWQYTVDDEPEAYRSIPDDEVAYAGGDGSGPGNSYSIHIEMCVNIDGNYLKTVSNTVELVRYLLNKYPSITHIDVVQHYKWSGKDCPRYLRSGVKGIDWNGFLKQVREGKSAAVVPVSKPKYETTNNNFSIGQQVRVKKSATHYATGQAIPAFVKGKTDTVLQRGSNRMLLKGIYSWVKTSDLEFVSTSVTKPTPELTKSVVKPSVNQTDSIVDYLNSKGLNSSLANRKKLADQHGIKNYTGTASQNTTLLNKLRNGTVPKASPTKKGDQKTSSVVDYLKSIGQNSSFANRRRLADQYGIKNYKGTAAQNTQLLNKIRK